MPDEQHPSTTSDTPSDEELAARAASGDASALESLIIRYWDWAYNLAIRVVYRPEDAEDVVQEAMTKVVTRLSTFRSDSQFKTWFYRIVVNHAITMKRRPVETMVTSFSRYASELDAIPDSGLPDPKSVPVDASLLVEEARISCMMGMLLCLDRRQRVVYVLGELMGVPDIVGAEIMETSRANFRQLLKRARDDLYKFMDGKCGLVRTDNPCRCVKKTAGFVKLGVVDPNKLVFAEGHVRQMRDIAARRVGDIDRAEGAYADLFRDHPCLASEDASSAVRRLLATPAISDVLRAGSG